MKTRKILYILPLLLLALSFNAKEVKALTNDYNPYYPPNYMGFNIESYPYIYTENAYYFEEFSGNLDNDMLDDFYLIFTFDNGNNGGTDDFHTYSPLFIMYFQSDLYEFWDIQFDNLHDSYDYFMIYTGADDDLEYCCSWPLNYYQVFIFTKEHNNEYLNENFEETTYSNLYKNWNIFNSREVFNSAINSVFDDPGYYNLYTKEEYDAAVSLAYNEGYSTAEALGGNVDFFTAIFNGLGAFFSIELLPNITFGMIIGIPFLISFVWFVIKSMRGGN